MMGYSRISAPQVSQHCKPTHFWEACRATRVDDKDRQWSFFSRCQRTRVSLDGIDSIPDRLFSDINQSTSLVGGSLSQVIDSGSSVGCERWMHNERRRAGCL
jgi:hypothetical protein